MFPFQTRPPGIGHQHEHLTDDFIRGIAAGHLRPGDKLPTEKEVKEAWGYGRTTLLAARRKLKELGLVEVLVRSGGARVTQGAPRIAQQILGARKRAEDARQRSWDVELAQATASYTSHDTVRSPVPFEPEADYEPRRATQAEVDAGLFDWDELVLDARYPDGTTRSHGFFHSTFKFPLLPRSGE
jgi:DNA-binding transcriptional MocR family regulator